MQDKLEEFDVAGANACDGPKSEQPRRSGIVEREGGENDVRGGAALVDERANDPLATLGAKLLDEHQ